MTPEERRWQRSQADYAHWERLNHTYAIQYSADFPPETSPMAIRPVTPMPDAELSAEPEYNLDHKDRCALACVIRGSVGPSGVSTT